MTRLHVITYIAETVVLEVLYVNQLCMPKPARTIQGSLAEESNEKTHIIAGY